MGPSPLLLALSGLAAPGRIGGTKLPAVKPWLRDVLQPLFGCFSV